LDNPCRLLRRQGPQTTLGRQDPSLFHHGGGPFLVENGDEGLPDGQLQNGLGSIEGRIGTEGLGGGADRLLIPGGEGPQGMLKPVAELAQGRCRDVQGFWVTK
jgi:hypothetical protein